MNAETMTMDEVNERHRERCIKALSRRPRAALAAAIKLIDLLTFKSAGFGFKTDRLTVNDAAPTDPTTYIVETTRPYFDSWVAPELNAVVGLPDKFAAGSFDQLREWCGEAMKRQRRTCGDD